MNLQRLVRVSSLHRSRCPCRGKTTVHCEVLVWRGTEGSEQDPEEEIGREPAHGFRGFLQKSFLHLCSFASALSAPPSSSASEVPPRGIVLSLRRSGCITIGVAPLMSWTRCAAHRFFRSWGKQLLLFLLCERCSLGLAPLFLLVSSFLVSSSAQILVTISSKRSPHG